MTGTGPRLAAGLLGLGLLLAACEPTAPQGSPDGGPSIIIEEEQSGGASQGDQPSDTGGSGSDPEPDGTSPTGDSQGSDGQASTPPPSDPSDAPSEDGGTPSQPAPAIDDRGPLGSACRDYLRGQLPRLTIEVLHQRGARPADGALDHLVTSLRPVLDKPDGIAVAGPREVPGQARTWSLAELRELASQHRRAHSTGSEATMLVLAVAGEYEDPGVLGLAMSATEIVLFPQQIGDLATSLLGGSSRIERSVLLHEAGHLLCLVNIGYQSEIDHEDAEHDHHSRHRDSVMFWAVENDAVSQVFSGPPPDGFHEHDLADLRGLREGRY